MSGWFQLISISNGDECVCILFELTKFVTIILIVKHYGDVSVLCILV